MHGHINVKYETTYAMNNSIFVNKLQFAILRAVLCNLFVMSFTTKKKKISNCEQHYNRDQPDITYFLQRSYHTDSKTTNSEEFPPDVKKKLFMHYLLIQLPYNAVNMFLCTL